jgi:hypothetical protein
VIGGGTVTGSVTTDGTIGLLGAGNFVDWDILLTGNMGATFTLLPSNSNVYEQGADVNASVTQITFNFSGTDNGYLLFQEGTTHSGQQYWCNATFTGICLPGKSDSAVQYPNNNFSNEPASGIQVIASVSSGVPEPSTWALILLGFGALGFGAYRRPRTAAAIG